MLPHLDVAGRFSAEPDIVRGLIVPRLKHFTEIRVKDILLELDRSGLIHVYRANGESYLEYIRFDDFQNLRVDREAESKIPEPTDIKEYADNSGSPPAVLRESSTALKDKDKDKLQDKDEDKDRAEFSGEDIRLVQLLIDLMLKNDPKSSIIKRLTTARQSEWIRSCRLLREADGKTPAEIEQVIAFSQADEFWKSNILSMPKLREKWDQLWLKARRGDNLDGIRDWLAQKEREHADKR